MSRDRQARSFMFSAETLAEVENLPSTPSDFLCPITLRLMTDPVVADDGHTYERSAILEWIAKKKTSPLTREKISAKTLRPNITFRKTIEDHITSYIRSRESERTQQESKDQQEKPSIKEKTKEKKKVAISPQAFFNTNERQKLLARSIAYFVHDLRKYLNLHVAKKEEKGTGFLLILQTLHALSSLSGQGTNLNNELKKINIPENLANYLSFYVQNHPDLNYIKQDIGFSHQMLDLLENQDLQSIELQGGIEKDKGYLQKCTDACCDTLHLR